MKNHCSIQSLHSLQLDKACLQLRNHDHLHDIEVWGQSLECYDCSPWKFMVAEKGKTSSIIVNSTYSTELFFRLHKSEETFNRFSYHFSQHGLYELTFNSTMMSPIEVLQPGNNEYLLLLYTVLVFGFIYGASCSMKKGLKWLHRRNLPEEDTDQQPLEIEPQADTASNQDGEIPVRTSDARLNSLDTFRGISIMLMIFVNYGGGRFYFFLHSPWNGLTVADLVFPWFMWIMGVCIALSVKSQLSKNIPKRTIAWRMLQRSVKLFLLGIFLNSIHDNNLHTLRIMGVLQRLSICYLVCGLLEVATTKLEDSTQQMSGWHLKIRDIYKAWVSWLFIVFLVTVHTLCTFLLHVPNCPSGYLGPGGVHEQGKYFNCTGGVARYIDSMILSQPHMYTHGTSRHIYDNSDIFDPEGLFATLMACITVALGVAGGRIILRFPNHKQRSYRWVIWSLVLGFVGAILCGWSKETGVIPVNKNLWSLSYVLVTGSFAFSLFAGIYMLVDVLKLWSGLPFYVPGLNSIFLYCGHEMTKYMLPFAWKPLANNHSSHFMMNISGAILWMVIAFMMHSRKLYFII